MIILRDYQQELVDKINQSQSKRNCVQSPTGSGKTAMFTFLSDNFQERVLILVNKTELLEQTAELMEEQPEYIQAGNKSIPQGRVTIAMIETFYKRIQKGKVNINDYQLVIADEVQNTQFVKAFEGYNGRLLGFTATPVIDKKEFFFKCKYCGNKQEKKGKCCKKEMKEYSRNITLKNWYGELITGTPISKLIELGRLVPVKNFVCDSLDLTNLKTDKSGQFTSDSQNEVFNNHVSVKNLVANYQEHCQGLKTMIFNANIEANKRAYETFKSLGFNCRSYDSKSDESRKEIVDWFRDSEDGILFSVGVFTTGFDVDDVQAIICNRAISSLSLYHQIVGRGGRTTTKIFKPFFKFIDLGGNVARFGSWSDDVDWESLYNDTQEKKKRSDSDLESFLVCHNCNAMIDHYDCTFCGAKEKKTKKGESSKITIAKSDGSLVPPSGIQILRYAESKGLDINGAKNLTANYIVDMFIMAGTSKETVEKHWDNNLKPKLVKMLNSIYFTLHKSELKGNRKRTLNDFYKKVETKINQYYGE